MRLLPAALFALALLLGAGDAATNDTFCTRLANYSSGKEGGSISQNGVPTRLKLVWGSEPAHAASALLSVLLRHVLQYDDVLLSPVPHPHDLAALAASMPFSPDGKYTELLIDVSTAWQPAKRNPKEGPLRGLAGPRLAEFGFSPVPARRRLLAWLAPSARGLSACRDSVRWAFYANQSALESCAFVNATSPQGPMVDVLAVGDCNDELVHRLQERAHATNISLNLTRVDRATFVRTLHNTTCSFLFLDYDMWNGADGVSVVQSPPCVSVDFDCKRELDSTIALRVADVNALQTYAPDLWQFVENFNPSPKMLRDILERHASGVDIEEAACEWVLNNRSYQWPHQINVQNGQEQLVTEDSMRYNIKQESGITIKETIKELVADQLSSINERLDSFHNSFLFLNQKFEQIKNRLEYRDFVVMNLQADNERLKSNVNELTTRLGVVEQHLRESNIEINDIPEYKNENLANRKSFE